MKPRLLFFVVVSLIQGYVLWSYAIITPRWTVMPGYPLSEPGRTVRMVSILVIIVVAFILNFAINKLQGKTNQFRVLLNTIISANIALVLTLVLSQILDSTFEMPSPLIGNTIWQLTNNPSILVFIIFIANVAALASFVAGLAVNFVLDNLLGGPAGSDNADVDSQR